MAEVAQRSRLDSADTIRKLAARVAELERQVGPEGLIPHCHVWHNTTQSIPNGAWTALQFNQESVDSTGAMHSLGANGRIEVPLTGVYLLAVTAAFAANATGWRGVGFDTNSAGVIRGHNTRNNLGAADQVRVAAAVQFELNAGDYVEAKVLQNSGAALNTHNIGAIGEWAPDFRVTYLGRWV